LLLLQDFPHCLQANLLPLGIARGEEKHTRTFNGDLGTVVPQEIESVAA
jgi:hypothetical protein